MLLSFQFLLRIVSHSDFLTLCISLWSYKDTLLDLRIVKKKLLGSRVNILWNDRCNISRFFNRKKKFFTSLETLVIKKYCRVSEGNKRRVVVQDINSRAVDMRILVSLL